MRILSAAAEVAAVYKTGGLGDMVQDLARELKNLDVQTTFALPLYGKLDTDEYKINKIWEDTVEFSGLKNVEVYKYRINEIDLDCVLIAEKEVITSNQGNDARRFALFSKIIVTLLKEKIIEVELVHLHDWHMGLLPIIAKKMNVQVQTVFTIHNALFQGDTEPYLLDELGISRDFDQSIKLDIQDGDVNFLMQGIIHSDFVTTVSPKYKQEILSGINSGGMEKFLWEKSDKFNGILNAIDQQIWNPETDGVLDTKFNLSNWADGKKSARKQLSKVMKNPIEEDQVLLSYIGRADGRQKGIQLILDNVRNYGLIENMKLQIVMLSQGDPWLEQEMNNLASTHAGLNAFTKFDDDLAHLIYAASDIVLIPSMYEPCGLVQMMAMRYGCVPIARATGGLADTIHDGEDGFLFLEYEAKALNEKIMRAIDKFKNPEEWRKIVVRAMEKDWSWEKSANEYKLVYNEMLNPQ